MSGASATASNGRRAVERTFQNFIPRDYLKEYYSAVDPENEALLSFFAEFYAAQPAHERMLEFSGGPTIYSLFSAAPHVEHIDFADFLPANLAEVRRWFERAPDAHDWSVFIRRALALESVAPVRAEDVEERAALVRSRVSALLPCDAFRYPPIPGPTPGPYQVLSVNFVPESITSSRKAWFQAMRNICSLLEPGGWLLLTCLKQSHRYRVGTRQFPSVSIVEDEVLGGLRRLGFGRHSVSIHTVMADQDRGYAGMIFVAARKALGVVR